MEKPTKEEMNRVFGYAFDIIRKRSEQEVSESVELEIEERASEIMVSMWETQFFCLTESSVQGLALAYYMKSRLPG